MLMMKIWNKNTSCRIEFKFFLLSTNVCVIVGVLNVIDIALIPRETTLDVNSYPAHFKDCKTSSILCMQVSGHTHKITAFVTIFNILYKD
jgi:hypothetical protein